MAAKTLAIRRCCSSTGSLAIAVAKEWMSGVASAMTAARSGVMGTAGLAVVDMVFVLLADKVGGYDSGMETYTLLVRLWLLPGERLNEFHEAPTPGLGEDECKAAAKLVQPPQGRAWCFLEGRPEPVWSTAPSYPSRTRECADCRTIKERGWAPG